METEKTTFSHIAPICARTNAVARVILYSRLGTRGCDSEVIFTRATRYRLAP